MDIDRAESRAEKDAKKEIEKPRGGGSHWANSRREDTYNTGNPIGMNLHGRIVATMETEEMTGDLSSPPKPKTLGPCFQCGAYSVFPCSQILQCTKKTISFYAACGKQN